MFGFVKQLDTLFALLCMLLIGGCQVPATTSTTTYAYNALPSRFTCCNFHYEGDWINDGNYASLPMIPAGTPATVTGYGRHRAYVMIGDRKMRLGHDYGREQETLDAWTAKMIVASDPSTKIASYPKDIQDIIRQGKVTEGMTKEQVIISVGYPLTSENWSLDATYWRMWVSSFGEYKLIWDDNGRVEKVIADSATKRIIYAQP